MMPSRWGRILATWETAPTSLDEYPAIATDPVEGTAAIIATGRSEDGTTEVVAFRPDGASAVVGELPDASWSVGPATVVDVAGDGTVDVTWTGSGGDSSGGGSLLVFDWEMNNFNVTESLSSLGNQGLTYGRLSPVGRPVALTAAGAVATSDGSPIATWESDNQSFASVVRAWVAPASRAPIGSSVATSTGLWSVAGEDQAAWHDETGLDFRGGVLDVHGEPVLITGSGGNIAARRLSDGTTMWVVPRLDNAYGIAAADVDGDGEAEICASVDDRLTIVSLLGDFVWRGPVRGIAPVTGSCTLTDLDGDGAMEVVDWSRAGLYVYDGVQGLALWADTTIGASNSYSSPAIAYMGPGVGTVIAVEGVSAAEEGQDLDAHLVRLYSGENDDWARSRMIWTGPGYAWRDVRDDATVSWLAHTESPASQSFRAQPALVGNVPDLTPVISGQCGTSDSLRLLVRVANRGFADSRPMSVTIAALSLVDGSWETVATASVAEAISAGWSSMAYPLDVPTARVGDALVVEVKSADPSYECNADDDAIVVDGSN